MNTELNDDWIKTFEKTDKLYQDFYKDDLYYIHLKFCYVNRSNEIEKIKTEFFLMSKKNYITREEMLYIIKNSNSVMERRYSLLSILKYNITLEPDEIKNFIYSNESNEYNFLKPIHNIDAITFEKTINMFQDLNELVFVYYEKSKESGSAGSEPNKLNSNNTTKRVYLTHSVNKKTIKNRYKD